MTVFRGLVSQVGNSSLARLVVFVLTQTLIIPFTSKRDAVQLDSSRVCGTTLSQKIVLQKIVSQKRYPLAQSSNCGT